MYFDKVAGGSKLCAIPFQVVNQFVYTITCLFYWAVCAIYFNTY